MNLNPTTHKRDQTPQLLFDQHKKALTTIMDAQFYNGLINHFIVGNETLPLDGLGLL